MQRWFRTWPKTGADKNKPSNYIEEAVLEH